MMNYLQVLNDLKECFCNLVIIQYRYAPKNRALIKMLVDLLFANNIIFQIRDNCLSVETSVGYQLDLVGAWVGINRYYDGIDLWTHPYFSLVDYSNVQNNTYGVNQGGFSNFTNFTTLNGGFLTYLEYQNTRTQVNKMGDNYFRELIKLKIIKNSIAMTCKNIDDAIYTWSNGQVYTTWDVMEVTYHYPASMQDLFQLAIYKNVLLAPSGCIIKTEVI